MIVNEEQIQLRLEGITLVSKINPTLSDKTLTSLIKETMGKPLYADSYKLYADSYKLLCVHRVKHPAPKQEAENFRKKKSRS